MQQRKICTATSKNYVLQHQKLCTTTPKNIGCNIEKHVLQHQKINHETWKIGPFEKHLLQQPKNLTTTFKNHLLQHPKNPVQHRGNSKGRTNSKGDGFVVQPAPALAITSELTGGRREGP
jgi:hypothetical protein